MTSAFFGQFLTLPVMNKKPPPPKRKTPPKKPPQKNLRGISLLHQQIRIFDHTPNPVLHPTIHESAGFHYGQWGLELGVRLLRDKPL